jgi:heme/copper-type cytochrome/quinol oxidase subunit 2
MKAVDTLVTGVASMTAVTLAPQLAEVTAQAVDMPITTILQVFIQVFTGVATLYKLFFYKSKKKETEENV